MTYYRNNRRSYRNANPGFTPCPVEYRIPRGNPAAEFNLDSILAMTAAAIRVHGEFISAKVAREQHKRPTGAIVWDQFDSNSGAMRPKGERTLKLTDADKRTARKARAWAELQQGSEYATKIAEIAHEDNRTICDRELGLACSIVGCWLRDEARRAADAARAANPGEHIGTVGERVEFTATFVMARETRFSTMYKFDCNGSEVVWFTSSCPGFVRGTTYKLVGTVKKHGEFRGAKNTTVNRVQIVAEVKSAA